MKITIEFKNIKKVYKDKVILENFNLSIMKGEFLSVVGSSGCGKTTLLKMVNGLITPDKGKVFVHGKCTQDVDIIELRRNIGYAIQGSVLFPHMSIEDNISYVPNLWNKRDKNKTKEAVKKWIKIVGLDEELLKRYPNELSGGQQQRVGIARALAASPDILLMDEPFGAVDEITRSSLQDEIIRIQKEENITIIFITHDIREALKLGSKVLVMDKGGIQQFGTPSEILNNPKNDFVKKLIEREVSYIK
ncbi:MULTISPECIES: ATP-binding cassette domain-containing protein [unclassified Romboutsia]|uniref:ATP-binding cassette domain-containing protein n=1 Tax=unclassified Romboutsia TaxID=2626894 RepID=UPI0008209438|nr:MULTISPECIES: ABC transporter ATP-binding protein [unclassified Romboutsia]SCI41499.1 Glycine betaine/L-proline transport ATP-binding protein ProV [uncultured Clostridium sp.]